MLLILLFAIGYLAIVFEHALGVNKAASALLTGVACWTAYILAGDHHTIGDALVHQMGDLSGILFFLLGAMTIVELIDAHDGFELITSRIKTVSRRRLLVVVALLGFVMSAVLDNLTASIVMMSLVRKLVRDDEDKMMYGGAVIVAANAGGVWSPIGDVTTTMLWIGGQITTTTIIKHLLVPALVSVAVPVLWLGLRMKGNVRRPEADVSERVRPTTPLERRMVLIVGGGVLLFVPVFKTLTHLPPFMGILLGLGVLWTVTELIHKSKNDERKSALSVAGALQRVDSQSILFFLGILLAIGALQSAGLLTSLAHHMDETIGNVDVITMSIGLSSAVVDNVPLVAAAQGMYSLAHFPTDHHFWLFLAYCAGTGGSILIIGSAAGIAVMGMQRITFGWYVRKLSLPALLGYLAGALAYLGIAQV
ncbi:MAG: sodium:proton antiporter NhaD [Myxococcales bacterium]|nr:sodium:proton antiporter NhaD [Myxococcales bacterium]